ncbi:MULTISPECIES: retropepsin-like aspartic protease [Myroides]|uniref:Acid protease n=1 Tax=Myroides albus TaxID=2562892 RepID=A0A6I3LEX8_9FLAO|nr:MULTISPECIES: retropepsin-like aspartic protease [Myroides]MTG96763.1 acid protease [Myroides albus]MVX36473.1 acid protease [Myroides sp. LoEW2-1]UVD80825.1 retroviral-like aspartic protease family protein [Myroides albus]
MENLKEILKKEKYKRIKFKISRTQHLFVRAKINGVWGDFILDTGASNSCIDFSHIDMFNIVASESTTKATGAGANGLFTQVSYKNHLQLGRWHQKDFNFVLLDLTHVNNALTEYKTKNVHGIIGSDVLLIGEAIIDYKECTLYIK